MLDLAERRVQRFLQWYPLDILLKPVLDHKDVVSTVRLRATDRTPTQVVLQRYPLDIPLEPVLDHKDVVSTVRLRATDREPTQVVVELTGKAAATDRLNLLNNGEAIHVHSRRLDLTLVSRDIAPDTSWRVHPTLTSNHYAAASTLHIRRPLPPLRRNIKKTDWSAFQAALDQWWAT